MPDRIGRRWSALLAGGLACLLFAAEARACIRTGADATDKPTFAHPVPGAIQSTFGIRFHPLLNVQRAHNGIDYVSAVGDEVHAAASGEVINAGPLGEFGNAILIRHSDGWETFYAHLSRISVRQGDCVGGGDVIATSGNTGFSAGPQLHFETRRNGIHVDPLSVLPPGRPQGG